MKHGTAEDLFYLIAIFVNSRIRDYEEWLLLGYDSAPNLADFYMKKYSRIELVI